MDNLFFVIPILYNQATDPNHQTQDTSGLLNYELRITNYELRIGISP
ncbi:hypothetical protein [Nostoc sp. WHI]|nr:hypothetical protein [Nostoc sp. WHI]